MIGTLGLYFVTVEDANGTPLRTIERTTRLGRPTLGEEIEIDGAVYRVRRVRHVEERPSCSRLYTEPHLFVRVVVRG
jgi:hypothetical protein